MIRRTHRILSVAVAVAALVAPSAAPAAHDPVIPAGAHVAGLDIGGLPLSLAAARIDAAFGDRLRANVSVRVAGEHRRLTPRFARLRFDPLRSARRANIAARRAAPAADGSTTVDVAPWVRFSARRVAAFVRRVARSVARPARRARLRFAVTRLRIRPARAGYRIDRRRLRARIERALEHPGAARAVRVRRRKIRPDVRRDEVVRRHRTVVTVQRRGFRLRVFRDLKRVASYRIAVGMPGYATPRGRFRVTNKAVDPAWSAPDRPWAGEYRNQLVAGGSAANPLKARWLGIVDGIGIHGTAATWSLGRRASHGCIRMAVPAVKRVYDLVPVGALVMIK